jgi:Tfp pilus assembly protein PilN
LTEARQNLEVKPPPAPPNLDPSYIAAYGAALQPEDSWRESLLTAELEREIIWRHRARLAIAAAAFVAALLFAGASLDAYRARAERLLDGRIATLREQAASAMGLQSRSETLLRELRALAEIREGRPDVLSGLLELSRTLPEGAWLQSLQINDDEWQIDGYARDAAALIPRLEAGPGFEEVRFLAGTNRMRVGAETYENFSLAFRRIHAP